MERPFVITEGAPLGNREQTEFVNRNLYLVGPGKTPLANVRGVVLPLSGGTVARVAAALQGVAQPASREGARIYIVATTAGDAAQALGFAKAAGFPVAVKVAPPPHVVAQELLEHNAGRPAGSVTLGGDTVPARHEFLLRRAFNDCTEVIIRRIPGARTGATYCAYATIRSRTAPHRRPLPFFVKIARAGKIRNELERYDEIVRDFVPFASRPNFDDSRCIEVGTLAIIVGNFVEEGETLSALAGRGIGIPLLEHLFDVALRGWRLEAMNPAVPPATANIPNALMRFGRRVPVSRQQLAHALGASVGAATATEGRLVAAPQVVYRHGPIHGDLHASNVMMRGRDGILIDFASAQRGPIVADCASLEVDLICSNPCREDPWNWQQLVDRLYDPATINTLLPPAESPAPREWLWNAVRQVRAHALETLVGGNADAYRQALATYFYRRATFPIDRRLVGVDAVEEEFRRAYALVVAERLI